MTRERELWQLMHPAAGRIKGIHRPLIDRLRAWLRFKRGECPWFAQV